MSIAEIVLFISTTSKACVPPIQFVQKYKLPINVVRLDTQDVRETVMNAQPIPIKVVPSLLVEYIDGEIKVFEGHKVIQVLQRLINNNLKPNASPTSQTSTSGYTQVAPQPNIQYKPKSRKSVTIVEPELESELSQELRNDDPNEMNDDFIESQIQEENNQDDDEPEFIELESEQDKPKIYKSADGKKLMEIQGQDKLQPGIHLSPEKSIKSIMAKAQEMRKQFEDTYDGLQ